jgi:hypothetical protein
MKTQEQILQKIKEEEQTLFDFFVTDIKGALNYDNIKQYLIEGAQLTKEE